MQNDKLITISIGASRTSKQWTRTEMLWSEFCERLKIPVRTTETVDEYHRLPKSEKSKLKDIGGFVGGTLNGLQRKAINVSGRDLITLDMDAISPGETENVARTIDSLGMAYVIYSTRSHTVHRPRLRVMTVCSANILIGEMCVLGHKYQVRKHRSMKSSYLQSKLIREKNQVS